MTSIGALDPGHLTEVTRLRAVAEAAQTRALLAADDAALREAAGESSSPRRQLHVRAARVEIAMSAGLSEGQLRARLTEARAVRERLPRVESAHDDGRVDGCRVHLIAEALARLESDAAADRLDATVVPYATTHTTVELKAWLRRFVARTEPETHAEEAERSCADRQVSVRHGEDGMSELWALLPTLQAATLDARLRREAQRLADDGRTLAQRRADLLAAWATGPTATAEQTPSVRPSVDVAVVVTVEALAGESEEPVVSSDGAWVVPVGALRDLVARRAGDNVFWHRLLTDPAGGTLDHTYLGRFAPDLLARAVRFRDGVCQVPGCTVPAERCDLDHRDPWPRGKTRGDDLWAVCRPHHVLKSHGFLVPVARDGPNKGESDDGRTGAYAYARRLPSGRVVAAERVVQPRAHQGHVPETPESPASRIEAYLLRLVRDHTAPAG